MTEGNAASDADRERRKRRARGLLVALLVLLIVGGVGGWIGWGAYERHELSVLREKIAAEGGINPRINRPRLPRPPIAPPGFLEEMARREEARQAVPFQEALTAWQATPADQRDAMIDKLLLSNRARFQRVVDSAATRPATGNGPRAEFIAALARRLAATAPPPKTAPTAKPAA